MLFSRTIGASCAASLALCLTACTNVGTLELPTANVFAAKVPFVVPPASSAAASIRSVSVVPLGGEASGSMARFVEGDMIKLKFQEEPYYKKVVLEENVASAALNPGQLQAIVTRSNTQGVASVRYLGSNVTRRTYQESRSDCSKKVGMFKLCPVEAQTTHQVSCEERTAVASAELRVYDRAASKVVLSDTVNGQYVVARCSDATTAVDADNVLVATANGALQKRILSTIAPSTEMRPLDFMEPDEKVAPAAVTGFQQALSFGRAKRLDEACARFADLYDNEKESPALTYNTGFCDEARGDLVGAVSRYKRASELFGRPNGQIDRHLTASERAIKEIGILTVSGTKPPPGRGMQDAYVPTGRRVALVIGNARYQVGSLPNPVNDARLVELRLRKLGFEVTTVENVNAARLRTVVDDFAAKSSGADVALFYYSGHAIQVDGENYLLPVDNAALADDDTLRERTQPLGIMMAKLSGSSGPRVKLFFIDACRNSPFQSKTRSLSGGLAQIAPPPKGALVVFATAPGRTALDGGAVKNSVFTKNFAAIVDVPGVKVEDMVKQLRVGVLRDTKNQQEPSEVSSLTGDFYFRPTR